jgi:hypothetical protein
MYLHQKMVRLLCCLPGVVSVMQCFAEYLLCTKKVLLVYVVRSLQYCVKVQRGSVRMVKLCTQCFVK